MEGSLSLSKYESLFPIPWMKAGNEKAPFKENVVTWFLFLRDG
jgi:hypothetical protein